ncbi:hypothetical protein [Pseudovibrio sp. Ad26]|uniref:head-tail connector protein n=1 Tax=Pseudovibrio sp. Ad26 TaxID=989410 RepID=UPI0007AE3A72|nr:hypothetical protein [Pseudovibrio sp. Ad26]KZK99153.1 Phage gp6-like head-tail connector protein [Pseudovibrio sp. Ad26]
MTTHFDDRGYYERVSGPVEALLSLQDVKRQVCVKHSDDDDILQRLIGTATEFLDGPSGCLGQALVTQVWRCAWSRPPCGNQKLKLPCGPVQKIESASYFDTDGNEHSIDPAKLWLLRRSSETKVFPGTGFAWPSMSDHPEALSITFTVGYGSSADVPSDIIHAAHLMVGNWYEHREPVVVGTIASELPLSAQRLIDKNRVGWVSG